MLLLHTTATLYLAGSAETDEATANITARTYPEQIEMFPTPDRVQYDDGQLLSMRCTGRIGNQFDENNLQNLWTWEWRSGNNEFASWTRYPNNQNITYDRPTSVAECQYTGASTLVHTVSNLDNGRQFRCSVISEEYSANKTVYVVGQQPPRPTTPAETPTNGQQPPRPTTPAETPTNGQQPPRPTTPAETPTNGQQPSSPTTPSETPTYGQQPPRPTTPARNTYKWSTTIITNNSFRNTYKWSTTTTTNNSCRNTYKWSTTTTTNNSFRKAYKWWSGYRCVCNAGRWCHLSGFCVRLQGQTSRLHMRLFQDQSTPVTQRRQ
ncbi:cell wall protein DAN4-like isoform X5 [Haliotis rubra]|uniref:cell wall protein DAN4-like isoform X5 n=1 Tax=Haliotis rubra TaxID=36100 RepID=UPI001EE5AF0A|nr:cell wall protein DAN4-like isoform X5 [Haliotis rubra]